VQPDVDAIVARLREQVEERRRAGVYPPELEDELAAHFQRIARYRTEPNIDAVKQALADLEQRTDFSADRIPLDSGMPGGERVHRALAKMQARQIDGVLRQVREFAGAAAQLSPHALLVNPYDVEGVADAIRRAFRMDGAERRARMRGLRRSIRRQDIFWWVDSFLRAAIAKDLGAFPLPADYTPRGDMRFVY